MPGKVATGKPAGGKPAPAPTPTRKQQPQTEHPADGSEGGGGGEEQVMDKSALFNKAKAAGQVDNGRYEGIIAELVLQPEDEKGQSVRVKYEIATDGDFRGESVTQWYKIFEANGTQGKGLGFLKRDLTMLGYPDVDFDSLEDAFEEIVDKNTAVVFQVKQNGNFTNVYLQGLCEDSDVIAEYLDKRGF